ncbi:hypothetical protein ACIQWA_27720 [Kitasatospora sp. NPDC098652]|uniref:hypothetical protein n=1 Tax=Kitasatospora sp. NPDC098652 TaxID=3364095 RepID=UPI0037F73E07
MTGRHQRGLLDTCLRSTHGSCRFTTLPFDREAARRFGTLTALTIQVKRDPRPHRMDLMIAATAAAHGLPLYTRN